MASKQNSKAAKVAANPTPKKGKQAPLKKVAVTKAAIEKTVIAKPAAKTGKAVSTKPETNKKDIKPVPVTAKKAAATKATEKSLEVKKVADVKAIKQGEQVKKANTEKAKPTAKAAVKKEAAEVPAPKPASTLKAANPSKPIIVPPKPAINAKPTAVKSEPVKSGKPTPIPKTSTDKKVAYEPDFTKSVLDVPEQPVQNTPVMRYNDSDLVEFRELINKKLDAAKKELGYLQGLITRKDEMGGDESDNRYMTMEDGSMSMEREQLSQMASRQITFIDHLEKAIMRIENKTYGICRVTGKLIDKARLRAVPHATLSMEAKLGINK